MLAVDGQLVSDRCQSIIRENAIVERKQVHVLCTYKLACLLHIKQYIIVCACKSFLLHNYYLRMNVQLG